MAIVQVQNPQKSTAAGDLLEYCRLLEDGNILYFRQTPFPIEKFDREILLGQHQSRGQHHKNIAYRPAQDKVTGLSRQDRQNLDEIRRIMRSFSREALAFLSGLLPSYAESWRVDYASFRPVEEEGRNLRLKARNDLLHVDAFPTRPTHGDRILRLFTNLHPSRPRKWLVAKAFHILIHELKGSGDLVLPSSEKESSSWLNQWRNRLIHLAARVGLPVVERSDYDVFMLYFHDYLKENQDFQDSSGIESWDFPPNSTWIAFTDAVPHAVLSGRYALEQSVIVSAEALISPEKAPVSVLEEICGRRLRN